MKKTISRRQFMKMTAGTGLSIVVAATPFGHRLLSAQELEEEPAGHPIGAWLRILPNNTVVVLVNKSEMGQGVSTALPMIVADELEADWKSVKAEPAPAADKYKDPVWGSQATGGSTSVRNMYEPLRMAGAAAREMLLTAAAREWGVPAAECEAVQGKVMHRKGNRSLTYGNLSAAAAKLPVPQNPALKKEGRLRLIGTSAPRLDMEAKANGRAMFGIDTFVPGMVYAAIARPPSYETGGAIPAGIDKEAAERVPGVTAVLPVPGGIAVCAETLDAAWKGRDALTPSWKEARYPELNTATLEKAFRDHLATPGVMARKDGDAENALEKAATTVEATYVLPYLYHATMEPMNCTAHAGKDRCDIWVPTQNQTGVQALAVKMTGLKPEQVRVHTTFLGGGYGRRFETDVVEEALTISLSMRKPVKLVWTREEDVQNDFFRPATCSMIRGALDKAGNVTAWSHKIVCPSIFARVFPGMVKDGIDNAAVEGLRNMEYEIPNIAVEYVRIDAPPKVGFWRSVGSSHNAFTVESFVDELARAAGKDPLEFRLRLLKKHPRAARVLQVAAEKAGWGRPPAKGHALGIACHLSFKSYVAQVAEVSVNRENGAIRVHKVTCAVDCGPVVNPAIVRDQMMGGLIMGLSAAMREQIEFADGGVKSRNFRDYELLRMSEAPEVDVHIVKSGAPQGGIGEPGTPVIAPAVANAVFAASGARVRRLPMTPETVRGAMKKG